MQIIRIVAKQGWKPKFILAWAKFSLFLTATLRKLLLLFCKFFQRVHWAIARETLVWHGDHIVLLFAANHNMLCVIIFLRDILSLDGNSKIVLFLFHTNLSAIAHGSHKLVMSFLQNFEKMCIIREKVRKYTKICE